MKPVAPRAITEWAGGEPVAIGGDGTAVLYRRADGLHALSDRMRVAGGDMDVAVCDLEMNGRTLHVVLAPNMPFVATGAKPGSFRESTYFKLLATMLEGLHAAAHVGAIERMRAMMRDGVPLGHVAGGKTFLDIAASQLARDEYKVLRSDFTRACIIGVGNQNADAFTRDTLAALKHANMNERHPVRLGGKGVVVVPHTIGTAAAVCGCRPMMDAYLAHGGNPNATISTGASLWEVAATRQDGAMVAALLKAGAKAHGNGLGISQRMLLAFDPELLATTGLRQ